jgi:hypothetical protein
MAKMKWQQMRRKYNPWRNGLMALKISEENNEKLAAALKMSRKQIMALRVRAAGSNVAVASTSRKKNQRKQWRNGVIIERREIIGRKSKAWLKLSSWLWHRNGERKIETAFHRGVAFCSPSSSFAAFIARCAHGGGETSAKKIASAIMAAGLMAK